MIKRLVSMNERGFFLPYVLAISVVILCVIVTSLTIYNNERKMTHMLLEQLEVETLFQMSRVQFKEDALYKINDKGQITYEYPNGTVIIQFVLEDEQKVSLDFSIKSTNDFLTEFHHIIHLEDNINVTGL